MSSMFMDVLANIQFQDVARQQIELVQGALSRLNAHVEQLVGMMSDVGAFTMGENEETCVVYGMQKEAMKMGAVCEEIPLQQIAGRIVTVHAMISGR